jgi:hypothetical protein
MEQFAKSGTDKTGPHANKTGPNHRVIVNKIRDLFPKDTVKALAAWLKVSVDTARHRIKGEREFNLDEIIKLLRDEHGFEILSALMSRAERKPRWWLVCEPLMELADAERLVAEAQRRTRAAIRNREGITDALETEIRRAQTLAIHGEAQAGVHADALRAQARVVAPKRR